jgi:hypothetical protein
MRYRKDTASSAPEVNVPAFEPVPRKFKRHDGWTPERQVAFIAALARGGTVRGAAAAVGMAPEGAYMLRRTVGGESFAFAWDVAQEAAAGVLADIAWERAVEGVPYGIYRLGQKVGEERRYNDRLLMFILRHLLPQRFGTPTRLPPAPGRAPAWSPPDAATGDEHDLLDGEVARIAARLNGGGRRD